MISPPPAYPEMREFYHSLLWIENGILFCKYKQELVINIDVARDMVRDRTEIQTGQSMPLFVDFTELLYVDPLSRRYFASAEASVLVSAKALHTTDSLLMLLGTVFVRTDHPSIITKVFLEKAEGLMWLERFKLP